MTNRDWGGLRSIIDEAKQIKDDQLQNPSPACPLCGTVLDIRPRDGARNCPMGHYSDNGRPAGGY